MANSTSNTEEPVKLFDISNYKPSKLPWLKTRPIHKPRSPLEKGLLGSLNEPENMNNDKIFKLFEYSLPPFLNKKYHNFNIENYNEQFDGDNGLQFIYNSMNFLHWNQSIYYGYCEFMYEIRDEHSQNKDLFSWNASIDEYIYVVHKPFYGSIETTLNDDDLCQSSSEFLLEPCVLIQLPWQPSLYHQWLTAALAEVLLFEIDTLELRHWPMSDDMIPLVTNLLTLVRNLKERIMFGFAILNEQTVSTVANHCRHERKFIENIMDNVILPSLPTLEFLTSNNSKICIQNIKQLHYSQTNRNSYVHVDSFTLLETLDIFSCKFAYNFHKWLGNVTHLFDMIPEKIGYIASQLHSRLNNVIECEYMHKTKPVSLNELGLMHFIELLFGEPKGCLVATIDVVCEMIVKTGKLKGVTVNDVKNKFSTKEAQSFGYKLDVHELCKENLFHHAVRQACIYFAAYGLLVGMEKHDSVASQLLGLQLELLKQEQIIRLTNTCSLLFNAEIVIPKLEAQTEHVSIEKIMSEIQNIHEDVKIQKRKSFWMKFPKSWRQNVNPNDEIVEPKSIDKLVLQLRDRIGRLIVNCNKKYLENNKCDNYYEEINIIHYLLPCFVYTYAQICRKNPKNLIYFKFIKTLICKQFEESFINFSKIKSKIIPYYMEDKDLQVDSASRVCKELNLLCQSYLSCIKIASENSAIIHNTPEYLKNLILKAVFYLDSLSIINDAIKMSAKPLVNIMLVYNKSMRYMFKFLQNTYNISYNIGLDIPNADTATFPNFRMLKELYYASLVLFDLSWIIPMGAPAYISEIEKILTGSYKETLHLKLLCAVDFIQLHVFSETKSSAVNAHKYYFDFDRVKMYMKLFLASYCSITKLKHELGLPPLEMDLETIISMLPYSSQYASVKKIVQTILHSTDIAQQINEALLPIIRIACFIHKNPEMKFCRTCGLINVSKNALRPCKQCVKQKYPNVNYYCSKKCESKMWKLEHMAEHLEFELDLGEFSSKSKTSHLSDEEN